MPEKTLKQRMRDGEQLACAKMRISTDRDECAAILDQGDYDFIWIDSQHTAFNEERLVEFCDMADEFDMPVHLRIKHTRNAYLIGNYLDLGPSGIEVPQVELESTVDEAICGFYYSPVGLRSWGGNARRGTKEGQDRIEYARWWNEYGVLWMQVESVEAVTNVRTLAKTGVDCVSFGPADLSFSLESHPNHPFKTVDDCLRYVAKQLEDTSVAVCFRGANTPEAQKKYIDMGVTIFL